MRWTNRVFQNFGVQYPIKGPFFLFLEIFKLICQRRAFYIFQIWFICPCWNSQHHSPGFITVDAPPTLFKKKINMEESTELDKVYFLFCLLVQYEKLSTNSLEPLDFWTQESKGKFNRMANKHACHRQRRLFRPSVRHTARGGGPGGTSLRRRLRLAQKWSGAYSC